MNKIEPKIGSFVILDESEFGYLEETIEEAVEHSKNFINYGKQYIFKLVRVVSKKEPAFMGANMTIEEYLNKYTENENLIKNTLLFCDKTNRKSDACMLPDDNGILLEWVSEQHYLSAEIYDTGTVELFYRGNEPVNNWVQDINIEDKIPEKFLDFLNQIGG